VAEGIYGYFLKLQAKRHFSEWRFNHFFYSKMTATPYKRNNNFYFNLCTTFAISTNTTATTY